MTRAQRKVVSEADRKDAVAGLSGGSYAIQVYLALGVNLSVLGEEPLGAQDRVRLFMASANRPAAHGFWPSVFIPLVLRRQKLHQANATLL